MASKTPDVPGASESAPATPDDAATPGAPAGLRARVAGTKAELLARYAAWRRERAATAGPGGKGLFYGLVASLLLLLVLFTSALAIVFSGPDGREVSLSTLTKLAQGNRVAEARILNEDSVVVARLRSSTEAEQIRGDRKDGATTSVEGVPDQRTTVVVAFSSNGSQTGRITDLLQSVNADYEVDEQAGKAAVRFTTSFLLPIGILANLFGLLFVGKGSGGAIGEVTNFGRVDDDSRTGGSTITFADVGGADEAVVELAEVRDYLKDPATYKALGAAPPKGVLLFGPPGTGKTLLARAVAGEAGVPFFSVAGAEFVESLVGVGAARIRDLFRRVNAVAPAIVFIDELDAAGRKRGSGGGGGGSDEREQTLNQLLVEMDGFDVSTGVVVIAATNRPDILDPALMRPGRFDRHITVERPDMEGRERILAIHAGRKPLADDVDLNRIAQRTPGFTGADLASVVNEAALLTIRQKLTSIHQRELEDAVVRVLEGPQRRGRVLTEAERRRAAYHEMGHVVVAASMGRLEDLHRVSILGRGRTLAAATFADSEATLLTRSDLHDQLVATLGGVAAEELVLGEGSTGAEQDLEHATDLARDMVTRYGMSDEVGPVRLQVKAGEGFLGDDTALIDLSPETQRSVERAIRDMVESAQREALEILAFHRAELDTLAQRLEAEETLEDEALLEALAPLTKALRRRPTGGPSGAARIAKAATATASKTASKTVTKAAAKPVSTRPSTAAPRSRSTTRG